MKKSTKKLAVLSMILCGCVSIGLFNACGDETNSVGGDQTSSSSSVVQNEKKLHFERTTLSVLVREDAVLALTGDYTAEEVSWKSSDESIATVDKGVVTTKKVGVVTITASKDDLKDECVLTVTETSVLPIVQFNLPTNEVRLNKNFTFELDSALSYNKTEYADYTVAYESADESIASVDAQGKITGLKIGKTNVYATVSWRGLEIEEVIAVEVTTDNYLSIDKTEMELYLVEVDGYDLDVTGKVTPSFHGLESEITGVEFTAREVVAVGAEAGKVATCANDGTVIATGLGTATFEFVCEYEGDTYVSLPLTVTVNTFTLQLEKDLYAVHSETETRVDVSALGELTSLDYAEVDGEEKTVDGTAFTAAALERGAHEVYFKANGEEGLIFKTKLLVADYIIYDAEDLAVLDVDGYNVLAADIDCGGGALELGNFDGVLDGNGHMIYNVTNSNIWAGIFSIINADAVVKNVGFYNIGSTRADQYNFAIAGELHGTIENVSFHQGGTGTIGAVFNKVVSGCKIKNFVSYASNTKIGGFFSSGHKNYITDAENIFIFTNMIATNPNGAASGVFLTGETGTDYLATEEYAAVNFTKIFNCGNDSLWKLDGLYGAPFVAKKVINPKRTVGVAQEFVGTDLVFADVPFTNIGKVELAGTALTAEDYELGADGLTIKAAFLSQVTGWKNTLIVTAADESQSYSAEILKYTYVASYEALKTVTSDPTGYYVLTGNIDCGGGALVLGNFDGVLDGNGYVISNVTNSNMWGGIFGTIGVNAVVKNVGFYNIASTRADQYNFAIAGELRGTIENVSFHQGGTGYIGALFNKIVSGCKIKNFVAYTTLTKIGGFFSSGHVSYMSERANIYIFTSEELNANPAGAVTASFLTGASGTDYLTDETFKAIDFTTIFDCSATGVWKVDETLGIPLVKKNA